MFLSLFLSLSLPFCCPAVEDGSCCQNPGTKMIEYSTTKGFHPPTNIFSDPFVQETVNFCFRKHQCFQPLASFSLWNVDAATTATAGKQRCIIADIFETWSELSLQIFLLRHQQKDFLQNMLKLFFPHFLSWVNSQSIILILRDFNCNVTWY